ncbi:MarR family winged helix-turn-helix transcriptional regulator [Pseudomonas sp. LS44]|uniref:MarR family winged helix-turn-helix transcriptional regulator n=1 Tax=Pseudomonas sp. LS44 TaxID=1357074 RepID=UPI00215AED28|nr:MarR family winged helix-turn-helix transcriptional regulator [Pseudomonas sp. LS44]UVE16529.1 MarR family winged helix-turn-helix transcriptional regulator [Pseudomonas sp. LS44]
MLTTHCLCTKLRRASRTVTKLYDDALAEIGLNAAQYSLMRHLERLDQPSISALAEAMGLDRSTLGRNLRVLESNGLLSLDGGADQRHRVVRLTTLGEERFRQAQCAWEVAQTRLAQHLGESKREALMLLLDDLEAVD